MVRGLAKAVRGATSAARKQQQDYEQGSAVSREGSFGARAFPHDVKEACWAKADTVPGRDPERWRRDALGNIVFRKLVGCQGCLCHDYDHIVPYSKGGPSTLDNCQILQAPANRAKGARVNVSKTELQQKSAYCTLSVIGGVRFYEIGAARVWLEVEHLLLQQKHIRFVDSRLRPHRSSAL